MCTEHPGASAPFSGASVGQALAFIYPFNIGDRTYWIDESGRCFPVVLVDIRVQDDLSINAIIKRVGSAKHEAKPIRISGFKMMPRRMHKTITKAREKAPEIVRYFKEYDEQLADQAREREPMHM